MTLTIGIPSRGVNSSLRRVIEHALSLDVEEVVVGINPTGGQIEDCAQFIDPRLKIFIHNRDLGLYGNFRFLLEQASSTYFVWSCTDDFLSPDIPHALEGLDTSAINLYIPSWNWAEFKPDEAQPFDLENKIAGRFPIVDTSQSIIESALSSEPSWIFGVWRTRYLQKIMPQKNFDWLDTYLLQKVLLTRKVELISVSTPTVIGTWNWANKIPAPVSKKGHNPTLAIFYQLILIPRFLCIEPASLSRIIRRVKFLISSSRAMNRRLLNARGVQ